MTPKPWNPGFSLPDKTVFTQAWNIFIFSAIFAILFNTFYVDGIELKVKPAKIPPHVTAGSTPPPSYPGWKPSQAKTPPAKTTPEKSPWGNITRLSLIGTKARFDKKTCLFLDAREADKYKEGHIPGSLNFSALEMDKFAPLVMPKLTDKNQEMIVYCNGGDCTLSLELAQTLIEQGFTQVKVFEGGWPEWKKAAYPFQTGENP